jgi:hypothetical protein
MTIAFYIATCATCRKDLTSRFANFGTADVPQCWDCGMAYRASHGLCID